MIPGDAHDRENLYIRVIIKRKERKMDTEIEIKVYYSEDLRKDTLELSDRRVLWNITCDNFDEDLYSMSVQSAARRFMTQFGVPVYIVGRSGRHVVVEDNRENRKWYRRMAEYVRKQQDELIEAWNNGTPEIIF